jgi:hypothetical protein
MAIVFYDPFIDWQKLTDALDEFGIEGEERLEVIEHAEHTIHTEILIVFVTLLPAEKHQPFVEQFHAAPHDPKHIDFIVEHTKADVESVVRQRTDQILNEIVSELFED